MALIKIQRDPSPRQLRIFGAVWLVAFSFLGYTIQHRTGSLTFAGPILAGAVLVPLVGWFFLPVLRGAYFGLAYLTYPIGWVVSHVVLALVYYAVLTPIGLLMRLTSRDPMGRRFDDVAPSYWITREGAADAKRYYRQY